MTKEGLSIIVDKDSIDNVSSYTERSKYFDHSLEENPYLEDSLRVFRGILMGILISIPLWILILSLIFLW
jgi:hypothetical protein